MSSLGFRLTLAMNKARISGKALSEMVNVTPGAISHWKRGRNTNISADVALRLSKALNVSPDWLLKGKGVPPQAVVVPLPQTLSIQIPVYKVTTTEDHQINYIELDDDFPIAYRKSFFVGKDVDPSNCKRFFVSGDGMDPFIRDGDTILVDCSTTKIKDNHVYAVYYGETLKVKRLIKTITQVIVHSDNEEYAEEFIPIDKVDQSICIIGEVIARSGPV
jgi:transcriptional regulator with XRE-family HTH domain